MTPLFFTLITFAISIAAGLLGSLLGLGGGIIVIPALTLLLGIDIRYAIGASIVSVIATSSGAAAAYVRQHMTNLRAAMFLEIATTSGALSGAFLAGRVRPGWLYVIFGIVLAYSAIEMSRKRREDAQANIPPDRLADRLRLHGEYFDQSLGREIHYRVTHTGLGLVFMYIAGCVSGLLGIGSGALKVPSMDLAMRMPIKVSTATSNFMIGVTAAASAGVYFVRGNIDPFITAPVAAGVLIGALVGSLLLGRLRNQLVRNVFIVVLLVIAGQMLWKGAAHLMTSQSDPAAGPDAVPQAASTVEILISRLLRAGVSLSFCVIIAGTALSFAHHPDYFSSHQALGTLASPQANFPRTTAEVLQGILHLQGRAIVIAGLFLLIATPVMRVAVSIFAFAIERDWAFVMITSLVLALLILSFFLGGVEG